MADEEFEGLVYEAFRQSGSFISQTPEEVAVAEAEMVGESIELPESLRDPIAILARRWVECEECGGWGCFTEEGLDFECEKCEWLGGRWEPS
jgi:hypothetical protein